MRVKAQETSTAGLLTGSGPARGDRTAAAVVVGPDDVVTPLVFRPVETGGASERATGWPAADPRSTALPQTPPPAPGAVADAGGERGDQRAAPPQQMTSRIGDGRAGDKIATSVRGAVAAAPDAHATDATTLEGSSEAALAMAPGQEHDAGMVMATLMREQIAARGGAGHSHTDSNCGFCRRAVSRYG